MDPELNAAYASIRASEMQARERLFLEFRTYRVNTVPGSEGRLLASRTVRGWRREQRIFSFDHDGHDRYPAFQFEAGLPKPIIARLLHLLRRNSGWQVMFWFASANAWLDDAKCPVDLLDANPDAVEEAARHANDAITGSAPSLELFAHCLEMPKTELLALVGETSDGSSTHDNSKVQRFIWDSLIVLAAALALRRDEESVRLWYCRQKLADFEHKTPAVLIAEGKVVALLKYIKSISAGSSG